MGKAEDKLASLLQVAERELHDLQQRVKEDRDNERWRWSRHVELPKKQKLPVPRLEIFLDEQESDEYNNQWVYRMVYRHFLGHCVGVPLGSTKQGCCRSDADRDLLDMIPFRDGAHIQHDAKTFGWPMFIVRGDEVKVIPQWPERNRSD